MDSAQSVSSTPSPHPPSTHQPHPPPSESLPVRHRRRPALSCVLCRQRKVKCDRNAPCRQCVNSGNKNCTYVSSPRAPPTREVARQNHDSAEKAKSAAPSVIVFNSSASTVEQSAKKEPKLLSSNVRLDSNVNKVKFLGHSHWMLASEQFAVVKSLIHKQDGQWLEVQDLVKQSKTTIKAIRSSVKAEQLIFFDPKDCIPPRDLCDKLVASYLKTFETTFRILHIPTFWRKYQAHWENPQSSSPAFVIELLLVLANGAAFYQEPHTCLSRSTVMSWIFTARSWIHTSVESSNMTIASIQIQCLLILAGQSNDISTGAIPFLTSTVLRLAMMIGLHRDPSLFKRLSFYDQETRKRLWATVLELALQSGPASGMPPLVCTDHYDCPPPSNLNDEDFDEATTKAPKSHSEDVLTQTSWQIALLKSVPTRIAIITLIESIHSDPSYETVLQLSTSLTTSYESVPRFFHLHNSSLDSEGKQPTTFQRYLLDLCTRRFLIYLHSPFVLLSKENPHYYFSRKLCFESSLILLSYPTTTKEEVAHIRPNGGGMYKIDFFAACLSLFVELDLRSSESSFLGPSPAELNQPLFNVLEKFIVLSKARISSAQDNIKAHFLISLLFSQFHGDDIRKSAFEVASFCLKTLRARLDSIRAEKANRPIQEQIQDSTPVESFAQYAPQERNLVPEPPMMNLALPMDFALDQTTGDLNSLNWIFDEWDDALM